VVLETYIHEHVKALCKEGDSFAERKEYDRAVAKYREALELLPEPATTWEAATWIFTAIGDAFFLSGNMQEAYEAFASAAHCPRAIGNPFIHLRLGQIQLELGNDVIALDELARAYMAGGKEIFNGEDPKYFQIVKNKLKQPPSGW
jgi:tetratricopeptide (TPR) repeat protein